jgi:hypothetical protein
MIDLLILKLTGHFKVQSCLKPLWATLRHKPKKLQADRALAFPWWSRPWKPRIGSTAWRGTSNLSCVNAPTLSLLDPHREFFFVHNASFFRVAC